MRELVLVAELGWFIRGQLRLTFFVKRIDATYDLSINSPAVVCPVLVVSRLAHIVRETHLLALCLSEETVLLQVRVLAAIANRAPERG